MQIRLSKYTEFFTFSCYIASISLKMPLICMYKHGQTCLICIKIATWKSNSHHWPPPLLSQQDHLITRPNNTIKTSQHGWQWWNVQWCFNSPPQLLPRILHHHSCLLIRLWRRQHGHGNLRHLGALAGRRRPDLTQPDLCPFLLSKSCKISLHIQGHHHSFYLMSIQNNNTTMKATLHHTWLFI